jgi:hypothetical protein
VPVGAGGGKFPVGGDGFLGNRQRLGRAAQRGEPDVEVGQRGGEVARSGRCRSGLAAAISRG